MTDVLGWLIWNFSILFSGVLAGYVARYRVERLEKEYKVKQSKND